MKESLSSKIRVPDGSPVEQAASRVTHLGIGAHQDDLEVFAYHGIEACYEDDSQWFAGVTVTNGSGSARAGPYEDYSDEQMQRVRHDEQNAAAKMGRYALQAQLGYSSGVVKDASASSELVDELEDLLRCCRPETLYLHNPADKHDTHIAVLTRSLEALRRLSPEERPKRIYGCEVWRDLDWLDDRAKVMLQVDRYPELAKRLIAVFESQVAGGKDYVQATLGRRRANATYYQSHRVDQARAYTVAMDLKPLVEASELDVAGFAARHVERFKDDVVERIRRFR